MKHQCRFTRFSETKGTLKFKEDQVPGVPPVIGTLYVKRWALPSDTQHVYITLTVPEPGENVVTVKLPKSKPETEPIVGSSYPME